MRRVDTTDLGIVRYLLAHPRASYAELSRELGIGETTARRRVESLIDQGTITPAMIPNLRDLGFETIALVGIRVNMSYIDEAAERIESFAPVTSLHMTMGRYDLIATVAEPTLEDLRRFIVEKIAPLPGIHNTETFVSSRSPKLLRDWRLPEDVELVRAEPRIAHRRGLDGARTNDD